MSKTTPNTVDLPSIDFDGKIVSAKSGVYKCPYKCHDARYPAQSWKTEAGFRKHMDSCSKCPSAIERKEADERVRAEESMAKAEEALAGCKLQIGQQIFYCAETTVKPTHENRFGRMVKVRYEPINHYSAHQGVVEKIGWSGGGIYVNGCIPISSLCESLDDAKETAKSKQAAHDEWRRFSAEVR